MQFLWASLIGAALILVSSVLFYEILAHIWVNLPKLRAHKRSQIFLTVFGTFFGHTLCIWLFGLTYWALDYYAGFGSLKGDTSNSMLDYIYFSAVSYSSLGLGDVAPTGGLRLLIGVEAILGLLFIGWTVTFTFLVTETYLFHRRNPQSEPPT